MCQYIYIYTVAIPVHECSYWGLYIQQTEDAYKARFGARASAEKEHDLVHEQPRKWARFGARRNAEKSTVWCTKKRRKHMKTARFGARRNFDKSTIWCLTPGHCFTKLELHHDDACDEWCTVAWWLWSPVLLVVTTLEQLYYSFWFWKILEDVRCETTRNCYSWAGWTGLVQEINVISWCIVWGPGLARTPFTDCYSTRAIHNIYIYIIYI